MSVTEFKRRNKKAYFFMGTAAVLLPALIIILVLTLKLSNYSRKNRILEKELSEKTKKSGYVLKQDITKGQKIEKEMLQKVILRGGNHIYIQSVELTELVGKYAKCDFVKGTSLNQQCVYQETGFTDDMRIQDFDFMEVNSMVQNGDYIDIRIVYPSGEDYIVANHKKVLDIQTKENIQEQSEKDIRIFLQITEEEILRIASAYVDSMCYPGTKIYVISYLDQFQKAGIVNYPVNPHVFELLGWNPNVLNYTASEQERQQRNILEEHLSVYVSQDTQNLVKQRIAGNDFVSDTSSFFE